MAALRQSLTIAETIAAAVTAAAVTAAVAAVVAAAAAVVTMAAAVAAESGHAQEVVEPWQSPEEARVRVGAAKTRPVGGERT